MSLTADKKKWDDLHAALAKATEAANAYDRQLHSHYGRYETQWLKKGERAKLETLRDRQDKIGDKIIALLVQVSPRGEAWLSGVPAHWIRNDLTWEDAVRPKNEPLSVVPPTSYGNSTPIREASMTNQDPDPDPEAAGAQYADEQINGEYFMNWVHDQLLEASKMDPSEVLPLETEEDASKIAKNMLQQLEWDTKRDLSPREIADLIGVDSTSRDDVKEFYKGFSDTLKTNNAWLAGELLEQHQAMRGTRVSEARRRSARMRAGGMPQSLSMYAPAQVFINGKYQVTGTMTPSHGPEEEVKILLHITRPGDVIEVRQEGSVWTFIRDDSRQGFTEKTSENRLRPPGRRTHPKARGSASHRRSPTGR